MDEERVRSLEENASNRRNQTLSSYLAGRSHSSETSHTYQANTTTIIVQQNERQLADK